MTASALGPDPGSDPSSVPGPGFDSGTGPGSDLNSGADPGPGSAVSGRFYCPDPCEPRPAERTATSDGASSHRTSMVRKGLVRR